MNEPGASPTVLVVAEQLRRRVPGGVGRSLRELVIALAAGGPQVTLWASRAPWGGPDPLAALGPPVVSHPLPGPLLTRAWDRGLVPAPRRFDVVHAGSLAAPPAGRRTRHAGGSSRRRPRRTMTVHDLAWRRHPEATTARGARWHETALRRALLEQDRIIVPSAVVADDLRAAGAADERLRVVPWGADHLGPADHGAARRLLEALGVVGPYLLSVSTLEPRKNLRRLGEAFRLARPELPEPWPLVVVGPTGWGAHGAPDAGGDRSRHRGRVAEPPGVVLAGPVDDATLAALYEEARAFAYVPLHEGFGLPPVEALGRGLPAVVGTTVPSVAVEVWSSPVAVRVDPLDVDAIAGGLLAVSRDEALRHRLSEAGRAMTATMTWRQTAERYADIWAEPA